MEEKAERQSQWKSKDPVADEIGDHGHTGLAQTAEGAGTDGLYAIEDLKTGSKVEKGRTLRKHARITGVERDQGSRREQKRDGCQKHEADTEGDGHPSGAPG